MAPFAPFSTISQTHNQSNLFHTRQAPDDLKYIRLAFEIRGEFNIVMGVVVTSTVAWCLVQLSSSSPHSTKVTKATGLPWVTIDLIVF